MNPTLGHLVDLSPEGEADYRKPELMDLGYYDVVAFPFDSTASSSSELEPDGITYSAKNTTDLVIVFQYPGALIRWLIAGGKRTFKEILSDPFYWNVSVTVLLIGIIFLLSWYG